MWLNIRNLIAVLVILSGCGQSGCASLTFASPTNPDDVPMDLLSQLEVKKGTDSRPVAQLNRDLCKSAFAKAGLPEPPDFNGADPVPVRKVLQAYTSWVKTHNPKALADMAMIFQALDEHRPALECFEALLLIDPVNTLWRYYAGVESQELGMRKAAISFFEQTLEAEKDYATTYTRLGALYLASDDLTKAQANYEKYSQLMPNQSLSYIGLGRVEMARHNTVAAEALFRKAVNATTNDHMAYRMLSKAQGKNSKADEARLNLQIAERLPQYRGWLVFDSRLMDSHALAQTQSYLKNQMNLAQVDNDAEKLISIGEQLLERRPGDLETLELVASGYAQLKKFDRAQELVDHALDSDPASLKMLCLRSRILFFSGKIVQAYKALDDAIALDDKYANAYELRGSFMYQQQRFVEAREALLICAELDPVASNARLVLAYIHIQNSEFGQARKYLREIQRIDPNNLTANRLLQSLPHK